MRGPGQSTSQRAMQFINHARIKTRLAERATTLGCHGDRGRFEPKYCIVWKQEDYQNKQPTAKWSRSMGLVDCTEASNRWSQFVVYSLHTFFSLVIFLQRKELFLCILLLKKVSSFLVCMLISSAHAPYTMYIDETTDNTFFTVVLCMSWKFTRVLCLSHSWLPHGCY